MNDKTVLERQGLVMVIGVPGAGKTTLARYLCTNIADSSYVSKDMFQSSFGQEGIETDTYEYVREPTVRFFLAYSAAQLELGKTPIIDATYTINKWRDQNMPQGDRYVDFASHYRDVAQKRGTDLIILKCLPPSAEELRQRFVRRNSPRDRWKLDNWDEFLRREPLDDVIHHEHVLRIIVDGPIQDLAQEAISYISGILVSRGLQA